MTDSNAWTEEAKKLYAFYAQINYDRFEENFFRRLEKINTQIDEVEVRRLQKHLPGLQKDTAVALFAVYQTIFQEMANRLAEAEMSQAGILPPIGSKLLSLHERLQQDPDFDLMSLR